jgi:polyferredoxin
MVKKRRDPYQLRRLRQIVQIVFLLVFALLLVKALFGRISGSAAPLLIATLTTVVLTLLLGRVWCGWACPLGTILYWTRSSGSLEQGEHLSDRWWMVKYVTLLLILAVALLGLVRPAQAWMAGNVVASGIVIILLLVVSVALNLIADLFWCRYLCPLGAAVALLSKIAPMRRIVRRQGPAHCNDCSVCVDALTACTSSSNGFQFSRPLGGQR